MYLVDTTSSRASTPGHAGRGDLVAWIRRNGAHLWLSVINLTEIEAGNIKLRRDGQGARADETRPAPAIEADFGDVSWRSTAVALEIARFAEAARPAVVEWKDLIIAATAGCTASGAHQQVAPFGPICVRRWNRSPLPPDVAP